MRGMGAVIGIALGAALASTVAGADRLSIHSVRDDDTLATARGLAPYSEDFEGFALAGLDGQNGWSGAANALVIETAAGGFGDRTVRYVSDGSATFGTGASSPSFGSAQESLSFDVAISALDSQHCVETADLETGFLNTRICFLADGSIEALQVSGPEDNVGFFAATTGSWSASVVTRLTVEVDPDGSLRILQEGSEIFSGMDIASVVSGSTNGISGLDTVHENSSASIFFLDNLEGVEAMLCEGDFNGDGQVASADLALLLGSWGQDDPLVDLDESGSIASADLALLLGLWGPCSE